MCWVRHVRSFVRLQWWKFDCDVVDNGVVTVSLEKLARLPPWFHFICVHLAIQLRCRGLNFSLFTHINLHKQIPWNAYTLSILVALPLRFPFSFSCPIVYSHCINCEHLYYIHSTLLISSSQMHNLHLKVPMQDTCKWYGKKARINWKGMDTDKNLFADVNLNRFLLLQTEILDLEVSLSWEHWRHSAGVSHNLIL